MNLQSHFRIYGFRYLPHDLPVALRYPLLILPDITFPDPFVGAFVHYGRLLRVYALYVTRLRSHGPVTVWLNVGITG